MAPQPAEECTVVAVIKGRDRWGQEDEQPAQLEEIPTINDGYPDGAFFPHPIKELSRAGWAMICNDDNHVTVAIIKGPVGGATCPRAVNMQSTWERRSQRHAWVSRRNSTYTA